MKRLFGTPIADYLPAFVLFLATAVYLATAYRYTADSRVMPVLVAWSMLALLALDLVSRTETRLGRAVTHWLNPAAEQRHETAPHAVAKQLAAVLWLAGFALALVLIGVLYAVPLYVFASMRLRGRRSTLFAAIGGGGVTLTVWLLFAVVLRLQLYPGLLFGGN